MYSLYHPESPVSIVVTIAYLSLSDCGLQLIVIGEVRGALEGEGVSLGALGDLDGDRDQDYVRGHAAGGEGQGADVIVLRLRAGSGRQAPGAVGRPAGITCRRAVGLPPEHRSGACRAGGVREVVPD